MIFKGISPIQITLLISVLVGISFALVYVYLWPPKYDDFEEDKDRVQENQKSDEMAICEGIEQLIKAKQNLESEEIPHETEVLD